MTQKLLTMTNWIQRHVLVELTKNATRRYSELKPRDVEGNLFMYHLKGLIRDGLIEKKDNEYQLSVEGMQFIGTFSLVQGKTRQQPRILTAVICKNDKNEYLFVRWKRQPNIGLVSFPHGLAHYGESMFAMAALELAEKAGLEAELEYKGDVYVRGMRGNVVDRHMLVHLFEASNIRPGRQDELRSDVFENFWASLDTVKPEEFVPGFYEIAQLTKDEIKVKIFEELTVNLA